MAGPGFVKLMRTAKTEALMGNPNAFTLASVIAYRARRTDAFNIHDLAVGEALLGDYDRYGMTESQYRTAKKRLEKWKIATFKATTKGTIARLVDDEVYDINRERNDEQLDRQMTDKQRADDGQMTGNKKLRTQEGKNVSLSERSFELARLLKDSVRRHKPDFRPPENLSAWAAVFEAMMQRDRRDPERIATLIRFCGTDRFWQSRILNADGLRRNFDTLDVRERQNGVPQKEPKKCFRGCGRMGVDYGFDDAGLEYWWCDECYPFKTPGKGQLAKAHAEAQREY